jgi:hypothetical protein
MLFASNLDRGKTNLASATSAPGKFGGYIVMNRKNNHEQREELERERQRSREYREQEGNRNQQVGRQAREQHGWDKPGNGTKDKKNQALKTNDVHTYLLSKDCSLYDYGFNASPLINCHPGH